MNPNFGTVTIVGVGLLGGSLGLALKERGLSRLVRGVGHRQVSLDAALARKAIDEAFLDLPPALKDADLVVICTPAGLVPETLDRIRRATSSSAAITDVASTKAAICAHADQCWPGRRRFVGSHPMAGSEKFGPEHATADLYEGCVTILEPLAGQDPDAHETVRRLWSAVGASIVELDPGTARHTCGANQPHPPHNGGTRRGTSNLGAGRAVRNRQRLSRHHPRGGRPAGNLARHLPDQSRGDCRRTG